MSNETLIRFFSTYCDVNALAHGWPNDLRLVLENPKGLERAQTFKSELRAAITKRSISLVEFNRATCEDLDTEADMNDWLVRLWSALYDENPPICDV